MLIQIQIGSIWQRNTPTLYLTHPWPEPPSPLIQMVTDRIPGIAVVNVCKYTMFNKCSDTWQCTIMIVCGPLQCSSNIDLTMQWWTSASLHSQCSSIDCRYLAMNRTVSKPSVNGADIEANCRPCVIKGEMSEIMLLFHFANNDTILQPAMLDGHWVCNQSWDFP